MSVIEFKAARRRRDTVAAYGEVLNGRVVWDDFSDPLPAPRGMPEGQRVELRGDGRIFAEVRA